MGGCISALLAASVLQQSVVSADVEDTGDTTKSVQHAPAVHTRPNVQQKCSFCGQPRKGHTCLFVEGTIKWRDLCATVCQGGSRNGCARCRSSVTKRARGKEDAAGGAGGGVSISGGGSAHSAAVAATPKKKAMQGFLERQQASAPLEQARFKTQLFDRLKELGPDVVQNTRQLTRALLLSTRNSWRRTWTNMAGRILSCGVRGSGGGECGGWGWRHGARQRQGRCYHAGGGGG